MPPSYILHALSNRASSQRYKPLYRVIPEGVRFGRDLYCYNQRENPGGAPLIVPPPQN
jgi:hypothetical protein